MFSQKLADHWVDNEWVKKSGDKVLLRCKFVFFNVTAGNLNTTSASGLWLSL